MVMVIVRAVPVVELLVEVRVDLLIIVHGNGLIQH